MASVDNRVFKLVNFTPIGFKNMNYPVQFCALCRGYLSEVCSNCMETGCEKCTVTKQNDSYYHTHCLALMNAEDKKPVAKKIVEDDMDDD